LSSKTSSTPAPEAAGGDSPAKKSKLRENVESIGSAVILFLIFRTFVLQAFRIPSESMEDTLLIGDFLFVSKLHYGAMVPGINKRLPGFRDMERGDVVVFKSPETGQDFIKRCVAIEGDTLRLLHDTLYINGVAQDEPFTRHSKRFAHPAAESWPLRPPYYYVVPEDHFFAMGDNRHNSHDSRFFGMAPGIDHAVPKKLVVGKAMFLYASFDPDRYYLPRFTRFFRIIH